MPNPYGKPPKMDMVNGKLAIIQKIGKLGNSSAIRVPVEWMIRNKKPAMVSIEYQDNGLLIKPYEKKLESKEVK